MKNKLQFALDRSLDAAKELIEKEIDHIYAAFLQGDQRVVVPVNIDVNLTGEGLVKFKSKITYKGSVETEFEYDPDQIEMDFTFPGSQFGKLDLSGSGNLSTAEETEVEESPPDDNQTKTQMEDAGDAKNSPALFS